MRIPLIILSVFVLNICQGQTSKKWTLQECIEYAYQNNTSVVFNQLQGEIIDNNLTQAQLSRLPSLNGSGNHNYNIGRTIDPFTNSFNNTTIQSNSFSLSSGVLLYSGNQINNTIKQTNIAKEANDQGVEVAKNQIALQVASTYLLIIQSEENLKVAESQVELTENQLEVANKLYKSGAQNQGTVLNIEAQLANDKVQVVNMQNQIQMAYNSMINLLQVPLDEPFELDLIKVDYVPDMPNESVADIYETALLALPEIKQAELGIKQSEIGEKIATASLLPRLSAYANINTVYSESYAEPTLLGVGTTPIGVTETTNEIVLGPDFQYAFNTKSFNSQLNDNLGESVGVSLSVPIFNGYRNKTSVENAKLNTQISELNLTNSKNQLRNDITTAHTNLNAARSRYQASLLSVEAQQKNYEYNQKRFDAGLLNSYDLLNAKNLWFQAQVQQTNSKYEYIFRNLIIEFYKGNELKL
jgi:outer membrane protein